MLRRRERLREQYKSYLNQMIAADNPRREAVLQWRLSCFDAGTKYADFIEANCFPLKGKVVLDSAGAWGGHGLALAQRGAEVTLSDLNDHLYSEFSKFFEGKIDGISTSLADCQQLPYADSSFDLILGFELMEHIPSPEKYAKEVARLLKPGGVCLVTTPSRLRSIFGGEPHYNLRWLAVLPFCLQGFVAKSIFRKEYPFPIERQYSFASSVARPFTRLGLSATAANLGRLGKLPFVLRRIANELAWSVVVLKKKS